MKLLPRQSRAMQLSGTVSFPPTFPELADVMLVDGASESRRPEENLALVRVEQEMTPKLTVARCVFARDIRALFVPESEKDVDLQRGKWYVAHEAHAFLLQAEGDARRVRGIVYVPEDSPTFMHVEVGMTAAESAEYYPPIGDDRSLDHYSFEAGARCMP